MESQAGRERTLTLRAGISNRRPSSASPVRLPLGAADVFPLGGPPVRQRAGFTLFELIVVLFILSLISLLVLPKLESFLTPDLSGTARHLIGVIRSLHDDAEASKQIYRLNYDLDAGEYWASMVSKKEDSPESNPVIVKHIALPGRIRFKDVVTLHQGKVGEGKAFTQFYPSGRVEKTLIHLTLDKDRVLTLMINPLNGTVKIYDHYIEEEDKDKSPL